MTIRMITPEDPEWPMQLLDLDGLDNTPYMAEGSVPMPERLWIKGDANLKDLARTSVAIVGSRSATVYGAHIAGELANGMANNGYTIVSGGAFGIDQTAHRGSLASRKPTIAVLACGADRIYPNAHEHLFGAIVDSGGLIVSETEPGNGPTRQRFLDRNRLIAALTRGTIVVEAAVRSGSLNTARWATDLGRNVYAVPGPISSAQSVGTHQLIKEGRARLVTSADDVIQHLNGVRP